MTNRNQICTYLLSFYILVFHVFGVTISSMSQSKQNLDTGAVNSIKSGKEGDPFRPYLTVKAPQIIKDFGEEVKDNVRIRKLVFYSRDIKTAIISHKKGYKADPAPYGGIITSPEGLKDYIFRNDTPVEVNENGLVFSGTAGFVREKEAGSQEWALFHGNKIGNASFEFSTTNTDAGISAQFTNNQEISGQYSSLQASEIRFKWNQKMPDGISFFLDGTKQQVKVEEGEMLTNVPSGKHIWNLTAGLPGLLRPEIAFTRNEEGKVLFAVRPVAGATSFCFEYSFNMGKAGQN